MTRKNLTNKLQLVHMPNTFSVYLWTLARKVLAKSSWFANFFPCQNLAMYSVHLDKHHPIATDGFFTKKLMQVLTLVEVAEHYREISLIKIIYWDMTFFIITQPYWMQYLISVNCSRKPIKFCITGKHLVSLV